MLDLGSFSVLWHGISVFQVWIHFSLWTKNSSFLIAANVIGLLELQVILIMLVYVKVNNAPVNSG